MSKINFIRAYLISISYLGFLGIFMNGMKGLVIAFVAAIPISGLTMVIWINAVIYREGFF